MMIRCHMYEITGFARGSAIFVGFMTRESARDTPFLIPRTTMLDKDSRSSPLLLISTREFGVTAPNQCRGGDPARELKNRSTGPKTPYGQAYSQLCSWRTE